MGYELVGTPRTEKVTQGLAIKFRDMDPVPHDRPLNPKRIEAYRKMLIAGLFRPVQWATVHCNQTQATYRVNGKHTSSLFAEFDAFPQPVHATIEHYHCDDLDDVARLYATFDSRSQVRTTNDINRAFAAVDPELSELPSKIVNMCVTAIAYSVYGDNYASKPAAERAECLLENENKLFIGWVHAILGSSNEASRHLWRSPVVAAMHATFRKSRRDANEFWLAVRDGTGTTPKVPDRVLNKFLLTKAIRKGNGNTSARRIATMCTPREMYVKCLHAWNAWRRDTTTDLKYHAQAKIPAAV